MPSLAVELPDTVTERLVEHLDRRHVALAEESKRAPWLTEKALYAGRAARNEPKMLALLDKAANVLDAWHESHNGRTARSASSPMGLKVPPQSIQAWREAYRAADEKKDAPEYGWIYLACAEYLGLVT